MDENKRVDKSEDVIQVIKNNGPSLPVQIARETNIEALFVGAYLSQLYKEHRVKISNLKVGSSPLYYLSGQEPMLSNFTKHLNQKEKEAFDLLKENGILEDKEQTPVIRVALRSIKDFAIPFKQNDKIYWKFFLQEEKQPQKQEQIIEKPKEEIIVKQESKPIEEPTQSIQKQEQIIEKPKEEEIIVKQESKPIEEPIKEKLNPEKILEETKKLLEKPKKKLDAKEQFLEDIKKTLAPKNIEITNIEKHDKKQIIAKIKVNEKEYLMAAYNKKRFDESDLLKIYRKYSELNLDFFFLTKGELSKKTQDLIDASKKTKIIGIFE